jgi:phage terminase small subunit
MLVLALVNQPDATRAAIEAGYSRKNASSIG